MPSILTVVLSDGLDAVETACQQALTENVCSSAVVLHPGDQHAVSNVGAERQTHVVAGDNHRFAAIAAYHRHLAAGRQAEVRQLPIDAPAAADGDDAHALTRRGQGSTETRRRQHCTHPSASRPPEGDREPNKVTAPAMLMQLILTKNP